MRWFIRFGIVGLCLLLWASLWRGASAISMATTVESARKPFCFPDFLPSADMYAWLLTHDTQCRTVLLVQNISQHILVDVKILFQADGEELCFEAECIPPGQKIFIAEKQETAFDHWRKIACISYTARETENTSLPDKEDYSCK